MYNLDRNRLYIYLSLSLTAGAFSVVLIKADTFVYKLINALFTGGLVSFIPGLFVYVRSLGMFDLFGYGFKTLRKYSKHFEDELHNKAEGYFEYKNEKNILYYYKEPITVGSILLIASILLTIAFV